MSGAHERRLSAFQKNLPGASAGTSSLPRNGAWSRLWDLTRPIAGLGTFFPLRHVLLMFWRANFNLPDQFVVEPLIDRADYWSPRRGGVLAMITSTARMRSAVEPQRLEVVFFASCRA
jgi:hypothetical protein